MPSNRCNRCNAVLEADGRCPKRNSHETLRPPSRQANASPRATIRDEDIAPQTERTPLQGQHQPEERFAKPTLPSAKDDTVQAPKKVPQYTLSGSHMYAHVDQKGALAETQRKLTTYSFFGENQHNDDTRVMRPPPPPAPSKYSTSQPPVRAWSKPPPPAQNRFGSIPKDGGDLPPEEDTGPITPPSTPAAIDKRKGSGVRNKKSLFPREGNGSSGTGG